jgi:hypothetical protein
MIKTQLNKKPVLSTKYDWEAWSTDFMDESDPIGYGHTERDALIDLCDQLVDRMSEKWIK